MPKATPSPQQDALFATEAQRRAPTRPTRGPLDTQEARRRRRVSGVLEDDLKSEYQLLKTLEPGVWHVDELIEKSKEAGLAYRNNGGGRRSTGQLIHRHRLHSALSTAKRANWTKHLGDRYWLIEGDKAKPTGALFVIMGNTTEISLALGNAAEMAKRIDEPIDYIFCDPPWQRGVGLGRDSAAEFDQYGRPRSSLISGYEEVSDDEDYYEFSLEWIEPAAKLLRPGGHMAIVTGPGQAAAVQRAAEVSGLRFQNGLVVPKANGIHPTSHLFATSHMRITVMTSGPKYMPERTFNVVPETPLDRAGKPFPRDVMDPVLPQVRKRKLRYPNQLPTAIVDELLRVYTNEGDVGADFFMGSGTFPRVCYFRGRRCWASDKNPAALQFTMASMLDAAGKQQEMFAFQEQSVRNSAQSRLDFGL